MTDSEYFMEQARREIDETYADTLTLDEYVDTVLDEPTQASQSTKYLLEAIESQGTRTVIEEGEEKERYEFFDDPFNEGEHAILGNTDVLNGFVDDLREIVSGRGKEEQVTWIAGPTATGKSELKRLLVNGLSEYSKTDDGRRYTLEWNVTGSDDGSARAYDGGAAGTSDDEADWYTDPVQTHPLSVFPEDTQQELVDVINDAHVDDDNPITLQVDAALSPFSQEAYDELESAYAAAGEEDLFDSITDEQHLRVTSYLMDEGQGIGILSAEDSGAPIEKLAAKFMPRVNAELGAKGKYDARAFNYNGILAQGNGGITIVEDADKHTDILEKLMNIPEEDEVKIDKGISMDLDTQMILISNPNLEEKLRKEQDKQQFDDLRALRRRLDKHEFKYLLNHSLENQLLRRELSDENTVWDNEEYDEIDEQVTEAMYLNVKEDDGVTERELAPHAIEAAALYDVMTRMVPGEENDLSVRQKAILYDTGEVTKGGETKELEDFDIPERAAEGQNGLTATFTKETIAGMLREDTGHRHDELAIENVIMPQDVIDALYGGMESEETFAPDEVKEYQNLRGAVDSYIFDRQEEDVLDALMADVEITEDTVQRYVDHVFADFQDTTVSTDSGKEDPDPFFMKEFETGYLGKFNDSSYGTDAQANKNVREFRRDDIVLAAGTQNWNSDEGDGDGEGPAIDNIPVLQSMLGEYDWEDVHRFHPEFEPNNWEDETQPQDLEGLKEQTLEQLQEQGYSEESAFLTARHVINTRGDVQ